MHVCTWVYHQAPPSSETKTLVGLGQEGVGWRQTCYEPSLALLRVGTVVTVQAVGRQIACSSSSSSSNEHEVLSWGGYIFTAVATKKLASGTAKGHATCMPCLCQACCTCTSCKCRPINCIINPTGMHALFQPCIWSFAPPDHPPPPSLAPSKTHKTRETAAHHKLVLHAQLMHSHQWRHRGQLPKGPSPQKSFRRLCLGVAYGGKGGGSRHGLHGPHSMS